MKLDKNSENLINAILEISFELGRNYEQIYLSLDLYNTINFDLLNFAESKGAQFNFKNIDFDNFMEAKYTNLTDVEKRKFEAIKNLVNRRNELVEKYLLNK